MTQSQTETIARLKKVVASLHEAKIAVAAQDRPEDLEFVEFVGEIFEQNEMELSELLQAIEAQVSIEENLESLKPRKAEVIKTPGTFEQWGGIYDD